MTTTWLVAVDASARAPEVVAKAVALARASDARLRLLRAVGYPHDLPAEVYAMPPADVEALLVTRAEQDLRALEAAVPPELRGGVEAVVGPAWRTICDAAARHGASLVVVGSHGYGPLDRLIGTTAAKVVSHADRSVLVVRARD